MFIEPHLITKAKKIKLIVSDFDGVLTNGSIYLDKDGVEPFSKFNIYDGLAVRIAHDCGLKVALLSGRKSICTERMKALGMEDVHTGFIDKKPKLQEIINKYKLHKDEVAFIGDDLIDLPPMQLVGFKVAPNNAMPEVKNRVDYITKTNGGDGVLREVVELIIHAQDKYQAYLQRYLEE